MTDSTSTFSRKTRINPDNTTKTKVLQEATSIMRFILVLFAALLSMAVATENADPAPLGRCGAWCERDWDCRGRGPCDYCHRRRHECRRYDDRLESEE
ncbi:hypothetical protein N8T08_005775 [Aspergillus melleus]|uniref:Uncharacterized protein n=1 Tax=Aspergillus melleus TaxID=138277 RepID=A0ACC3B1Z1_9EURO|nr:hypothetical protein N8T08_005775 [Aspergillus melleus]